MQKNRNILQQKLENHRLAVDETLWKEMEKRLDKRKKRSAVWLWTGSSGVAAAVALLLLLYPLEKTDINVINENKIYSNSNAGEQKNIFSAGNEVKNPKTEQKTEQKVFAENKFPTKKTSKNSSFTQTADGKQAENQNKTEIVETAEIANEQPEHPENQPEPEIGIRASKSHKTEILNPETKNNLEPKYTATRTAKKQKLQIGLAVNSSFGAVNGLNTNDLSGVVTADFPNAPVKVSGSQMTIGRLLDDLPEENNLPPLSVGFSVRKSLTNLISVESGLTYTYLRSEFSKDFSQGSYWEHDRAVLQQHYVGIPLNASINILRNANWEAYFSLGGMIEKGIWLNCYRKTTYSYSPEIYKQELDDKIDGIQLSAAASLGLAYRISRGFSLYFEPKINYYFGNDQPRSFRTESPLNIGLNMGLRIGI